MGVCKRTNIGVIGTSFYAWRGWGFLTVIAIVVVLALFYYNYIHVRKLRLTLNYFINIIFSQHFTADLWQMHKLTYSRLYEIYICSYIVIKIIALCTLWCKWYYVLFGILFGNNILRSIEWITEIKIFLDVTIKKNYYDTSI
jgi:hypothetical protein